MDSTNEELSFISRVQKKLIGHCYRNLEAYYNTSHFRLIQNKFASLDIRLPSDLFACKNCDSRQKGRYFYKQKKIILCANNLLDSEFDSQATKLMIQAYDDARADIDPSNDLQMTCTLMRGVNLGGVCKNKSVLKSFGMTSGYKDCVRETTIRELMNFVEITKDDAEDCVHKVWDSCIYQYDPFTTKEFTNQFG